MIVPHEDASSLSDAELIARYAEIGITGDDARALIALIRGTAKIPDGAHIT